MRPLIGTSESPCVAFVSAKDFPNDHWYEGKIKECFAGFANAAKIDSIHLSDDDFLPLRLLLEVNNRPVIPS